MLSAAMEWSSALTPHQKQIRKQLLDDNNQMSTGHNVKIADHLIDNLHKKLKQLELFFTFFTFACNCLVTLLSHSTTTSCTPFFWGEFLTPPSMATPYVPLSLLYTHTKTHRYPKLNWSWALLIKVTLFFPVSCPIISLSYSLVQYNLIQFQKLPVLNHNCIISTTQQRNDFFFFFFHFALQYIFRNTQHWDTKIYPPCRAVAQHPRAFSTDPEPYHFCCTTKLCSSHHCIHLATKINGP